MMEWFRSGGIFMWPILLSAVLVIALGVRAALAGRAHELRRGRAEAVLFWGAFAAAVGIFGTLGGIAQIARVVERSGALSSSVLWGGVGVALTNTMFGLSVLLVALIVWYALRTRSSEAS